MFNKDKKLRKNDPFVKIKRNLAVIKKKKNVIKISKRLRKCLFFHLVQKIFIYIIWSPPSLSGLTTIIFNMGLNRLGSEASIY